MFPTQTFFRIYRPFLFIVWTAVVFSSAFNRAEAHIQCRSFFTKSSHVETGYKVQVDDRSPIKDQCSLGTCHFYSWVSGFEQSFYAKNGFEIRISMHHLVATLWRERSLEWLADSSLKPTDFNLSLSPVESFEKLKQYGFIPDGAWRGNRHFMKEPIAGLLQKMIQNVVSEARLQMKSEMNDDLRQKLKAKAVDKIETLFKNLAEDTTERFFYAGKFYSPQEFQHRFFPELSQDELFSIHAGSLKGQNVVSLEAIGNKRYFVADVEKLEENLRARIDGNQSVYLTYNHQESYVDLKTGLMSVLAFAKVNQSLEQIRDEFLASEQPSSLHGVQVIGYEWDPQTQRVIRWKIKNSWGVRSGDKGYFHMTTDYFAVFARWITFTATPVNVGNH